MIQAKKLIEVAMPIKEISAESVRDKSIRHGHISTLHLWWARRPLPVCRAVVFASSVPDPLDENCPQTFRDAVEIILGSGKKPLREQSIAPDAYKPYDDIPYTAAIDKMIDNPRNRLLMFIGKYSTEFCANEKSGRTTASGKQLSDASLIKWDNKNNEEIITKAKKLIWVAHNCKEHNNLSAEELITDFERHYKRITEAEQGLYDLKDRHIETNESKSASDKLNQAIDAFLNKMPKIFDPFAGGGAIPLEAARLGCRSFGNDINPVAHIIQKGSLEFPQKYGKPITYSKKEFLKLYGQEEWKKITNENLVFENGEVTGVNISNRLSFDVEYFAKKLLTDTEKEIGHLYPVDEKGNKPIAYYWARVGNCSNPSCKAEIPLLRRFTLCDTPNKKIYFNPIIKNKEIDFEIVNKKVEGGWMGKALSCPCCGSTTSIKDLKIQAKNNLIKHRLIAVIDDSNNGKVYRLPFADELTKSIIDIKKLNYSLLPNESMNDIPDLVSGRGWNIKTWAEMFSNRQLFAMQNLVEQFYKLKCTLDKSDYSIAIFTYIAIFINRILQRQTSFGIWDVTRENLQAIFARQSIAMMFDYPESNLFSNFGGGAISQLDWITRYIQSESSSPFSTELKNASSGEKSQFPDKYLTTVVTDPPYYDAIAYADLSDFFYVWLKRTLGDVYPLNFATPQTPKTEECTALKHHHDDNKDKAKYHFESKLTEIFDAIEHQTSDLVSIMFAHQSTEAWTTLCNSILGARMNITGSWALDTEYSFTGLKQGKSFLASSVTVSCKPIVKNEIANFKTIEKEIRQKVEEEVELLYSLGFRGADLLTACFGQAVSVFGNYEKVERSDGEEVSVAKLLEIAKESAFNALLKGFDGDDFTKFYIGWLQLYSFAESEFDDAAKFSRVGLSINVADLFTEHILIKHGNKQTLGSFEERINANKNIGDRANNFLIDLVHRSMALYKGNNRTALLQYIGKVAAQPENSFWRVITSLCEVLPNGSEDHKQALGLLTNKDSLIRESKTVQATATIQKTLFE